MLLNGGCCRFLPELHRSKNLMKILEVSFYKLNKPFNKSNKIFWNCYADGNDLKWALGWDRTNFILMFFSHNLIGTWFILHLVYKVYVHKTIVKFLPVNTLLAFEDIWHSFRSCPWTLSFEFTASFETNSDAHANKPVYIEYLDKWT